MIAPRCSMDWGKVSLLEVDEETSTLKARDGEV